MNRNDPQKNKLETKAKALRLGWEGVPARAQQPGRAPNALWPWHICGVHGGAPTAGGALQHGWSCPSGWQRPWEAHLRLTAFQEVGSLSHVFTPLERKALAQLSATSVPLHK